MDVSAPCWKTNTYLPKPKEVIMIVRLTYCKFAPGSIEQLKTIYNNEIVPVAREQKGNLGIRLIEPNDKSDDFISISEWATKEDAETYESSGVYKSLVAKLADFLAAPPVLKTYTSEEVLEMH
jgi:quinol monooxygenase YgiN